MRITRRCFFPLAAASAQTRRPNIVLIVADDLGYGDPGFQGSPDIRTPHLDGLAASGVRFTSGYVSHPFCSPARAGLLTGRYQQRFGHENNFRREHAGAGLPLSEITLADLLGKAGYATGIVGKWHLGANPQFHPLKRGFQEMYGFLGTEGDPIERNGRAVAEKENLTAALGREAEAFVRRHTQSPFFLYLAFNAPQAPPEEYLRRFGSITDPNRRTYAAMVSAMDDAVGRVVSVLRDTGVERDTLIFFLSNNGGPQENASSNRPLRGNKRTLYEGGIRVPFVVHWPAGLPQGATVPESVVSLDVFPTALAAAGIAPPADRRIDGANLIPFLTGKTKNLPHPRLFWRTSGGVDAAMREGPLKWLRNGEGGAGELYDLDRDPGEQNNLAVRRALDTMRLAAVWEKWNSQMVKPLWAPVVP